MILLKKRQPGLLPLVAVLVGLVSTPGLAQDTHTFHHEHVLGTSMELQITAENATAATDAEERVLREIERLSSVFSGYDPQSEFSRWQKQTGRATALSVELFEVLVACDRWQVASAGAFNPAVQTLTNLWEQAAKTGHVPEASLLTNAVQQIQQSQWRLDVTQRSATRLASGPLSLNAIAKGAILERACQMALQGHPEIRGASLMIGGDLCVLGETVREVGIVDPLKPAENAAPIAKVYVHNQSLATSGGYRRGFQVGEQWYSHLLDPRTGQPVKHILSATVVAPYAADADALATIFSVVTPEETARIAESLSDVEYLLVTAKGRQITSRGWSQLQQPGLHRFADATRQTAAVDTSDLQVADAPKKEEAAGLMELTVDFELNSPTGGPSRRPYVAIWLEDKDEFPVRTGLLWMQTKQPGPRWHRDLLRWYRNDKLRRLADGKDLIGTISGATRGPGKYKAVFDGKDDEGGVLAPGEYTLYIEAAREHGTYQIIRQKITLGADPIKKTELKNNVEIKSASFEYGPAAEPVAK